MRQTLLIVHLLGLAAFLGSVFSHIVLGSVVDPALDPTAYATLQHGKHVTTELLTVPGLIVCGVSGALLLLSRRALAGAVWIRIKLGLFALIALNAGVVLVPLGGTIAAEAAGGASVSLLAELATRESSFGAANLLMVLVILALSVTRPARPAATGQ